MKKHHLLSLAAGLVVLLSLALFAGSSSAVPAGTALVSESAVLSGFEPGVFPFVDTTPNRITRVHIAFTDATSACRAGGALPTSMRILVGQAGVKLQQVITPAANTGIGNARQCVFHVTAFPGAGGVPMMVTDIVVVNSGTAGLTGINTVTVSASVR